MIFARVRRTLPSKLLKFYVPILVVIRRGPLSFKSLPLVQCTLVASEVSHFTVGSRTRCVRRRPDLANVRHLTLENLIINF